MLADVTNGLMLGALENPGTTSPKRHAIVFMHAPHALDSDHVLALHVLDDHVVHRRDRVCTRVKGSQS